MQPNDIQAVVEVHLASFQGFFLTFLGAGFLRLLYGEILETPNAVALVAVDQGTVIGFVAGVAQQTSFYGRLVRKRLFAFAWASLGAALRRPAVIPRLFRALTAARSSEAAIAQAVLMSIAVAPTASGRGVGQQLVMGFLQAMRAQGISSVSLTTDQANNERTNIFYQQLGFTMARAYTTPEGRGMNEYVITLD